MKNALKYGAVLIGLYVVVYNGSKSGSVLSQGANGGVKIVKAFQGR